jgi:hypothetical protein
MTRINGKVQDSIKDNSFIEELKAGKSKEWEGRKKYRPLDLCVQIMAGYIILANPPNENK